MNRLGGLLVAGAMALAAFAAAPVRAQEAARVVAGSGGHDGGVSDLAFSPDGKWFASFSGDKTIRLWETATGRLLRTITANAQSTSDMRLLMGGRLVAVFGLAAAGKGTVFAFDTRTGAAVSTITLPEYELSPTRYGVTSRGDLITARYYQLYQRYNRWNVESGASRGEFGTELNTGRTVNGLSFFGPSTLSISPDDRWLVLGYSRHYQRAQARVELVDASSGRLTKTFDQHTGDITSAILSADGRLLASASRDKTVRIWDVASGRVLQTLRHDDDDINWIAFSPDGRWLASDGNKVANVWDTATGRLVKTMDAGRRSYSGAFSPDGKLLALGLEKVVKVHDVGTGALVRSVGAAANDIVIVPAPEGQLVVSDGDGRHVRTWSAATGQPINSFGRDGMQVGELVTTVGIDGNRWLLGFWDDRKLKVWDLNSTEDLTASQPRIAGGYKYSISPDGRLAASNISSRDRKERKIGVWDIQTGKTVWTAATPWGFFQPRFSPDGRFLSAMVNEADSGITMALKVWDVATGRLVKSVHDREKDTPSSLLYLPSVGLFAGWGSSALKAYDNSGRPVWSFSRFGLNIEAASVSPNYRWLAATGDDTSVSIRALASGQQVRQLSGNPGVGKSILFFDDSRKLAVGNSNGTSAIWSTESGELLTTTVHAPSGEWVTVTPEGFFVASGNGAALVHVVRGFETFGIDQFYQALYRPDLVREKLAGDSRGLVRQAAAQLDLNRVIASGNAPDVRLILPGRALGTGSIDGDNVSVEAEIADRGGGIGRVEWRVNGVTVGIDTPSGSPSPVRLSRRLALDQGGNSIEVVAYNAANLVASVPARASIAAQVASPSIVPAQPSAPDAPRPPPPAVAAKPRLFVMVAGVDDYAEKRIKLSYAVSDAREIARGFQEASGNLYQSVEVKLLTNAEVTKDKLDAAFGEMAGKTSTSDMFVLYLAGHGKTVDGRYYFIPQDFAVDGEFNDKTINAAVKVRGIAQDQWQKWFASVPARRSVILFDTCDSGTLAGDETQELERTAANDRLAQATGRSILAASGGSEEAIEGYRGHGLFTYNVLDAMFRSDGDNSGTVELNELAAYVYGQVSELSQKVFKRRQVPQMKLTGNYPLAKPTRILMDDVTPVAEGKATYQIAQSAQLQVQPGSGATVVRSLSAKTRLTVLESKNGWSLVAADGKPLGYVATRDLAPAQ